MAQTVVGIFYKTSGAQNAVDVLVKNGFDRSNIDMSAGNMAAVNSPNSQEESRDEGGISGFFKNLFGDDTETSNLYHNYAAKSEAIVTVYATSASEAEKAADILDDNGAVDLNLEADASESTNSNFQTTKEANNANQPIPVIEENLQVGKQTVQTGGVRLKSRIVEHPVEEQLRLREESVKVKRNTVDRAATDADFATFKEGKIEMTERAEVPVVSKQARVVEEVSLGKQVSEHTETVRDTVRKTEVDIEDLPGKKITIDKLKH